MECVGMKVIVVHGGGKAISRGMEKEGIEARFVNGLRVTCERSIRVVEQVLNRDINPKIVDTLIKKGAAAKSLKGEEILHVERVSGKDPVTGQLLDWGFVGNPGEVNATPIRNLLQGGIIPVITPLGMGPDGKIHNVNADVAAAAIAKAIPAHKLAFLSDVPGLLRDARDPSSLISTLRHDEVSWMYDEGIISGGMLPKISSCIEALEAGVRKVHLIDGRQKHSLLLEIFTEKGVGTEILGPERK
jgi:acetylglutamate kinase